MIFASSKNKYNNSKKASATKISNAAARYDCKLAKIGRLVRKAIYVGVHNPILHQCLQHGEEHLCLPSNALKGQGLKCCKRVSDQRRASRRNAAAAARYDAKLAKIGRLIALMPYINNSTPILHRCLMHGEERLCSPHNALSGKGLKCCQLAAVRASGERLKAKAAATYDAKLADIGKLERLDLYICAETPIRHLCLDHGKVYWSKPSHALAGHGLKCCRLAAAKGNTLANVIFNPGLSEFSEPCQFYIYRVPGWTDLVKPGISKDHERRASASYSRGIYGDLVAVWDLPTRRDALLIEGTILRDPSIPAPSDLGELALTDGFSEVRRISPDALASHSQALIDSLADHDGLWQQWALDNVPTLYRAERIALRRQMA